MKIAFLCGTLEPGHDGVGDYTRRLAAELIRQGHKVSAIALNDKCISGAVSGTQFCDSFDVPVFRLSSDLEAKESFVCAKTWLEEFDPNIISLQFVIFAFHAKGLPLNLGKLLKSLKKERVWHIMFHELWVGMPTHSPKKHILWGYFQRILISRLVKKLKPCVVHTQTRLYQKQLEKLDVQAGILPLFSNIPPVKVTKEEIVEKRNRWKNNREVVLVVFGSIHSYSQVEILVKEAVEFARSKNVKVMLHTIGRCGPELEKWVHICQSEGLWIQNFGEQPPERISEVLSDATIGITTTALPMVQKSGSVAAMQEHVLPVICVAGPWKPRKMDVPEPPAGIFKLREGVIEECLTAELDLSLAFNVSKVSRIFVKAIEEN